MKQQPFSDDNAQQWLRKIWRQDCRLHLRFCGRLHAENSWQHSLRSIDDHIFYLILNGQIAVKCPSMPAFWQVGNLAWIGPRVEHSLHVDRRAGELVTFAIRCRLEIGGEVLPAPYPALLLEEGSHLLPYLDELDDQARQRSSLALGDTRLRASLCNVLAILMSSHSSDNKNAGLSFAQRRDLLRFFREHISHQTSAGDLAQHLHLSPAHFRKLFQDSYGMSPRQWISRERLRHAAELLRATHLSIENIAQSCGYSSLGSFSRLFSNEMGSTPSAWRKKAGGNFFPVPEN